MRFFLAGRDRVTGTVRLVSETTFPSRQDALDSLGMLLPTDGSFEGVDLFVTDIEQATPVVIYKPVVLEPLPGMPVGEPIADAWESPAGAAPEAVTAAQAAPEAAETVEEPYADAVIAELEAVVAEQAAEPVVEEPESLPLMEALRRAADRMEADGIVAPEPVGEGSEAVAPLEESVEAPVVAPEPAGDVVETAPAEQPAAAQAQEAPAVAQWPWEAAETSANAEPHAVPEDVPANAESVSIADLTAALDGDPGPLLTDQDMGISGYAPEGIEEPAPEVDSMLAASADDGFVPKPVIMGDYGATVPGDVAVESAPVPEQVIEPVEEPIEVPVEASVEEAIDVLPAEPMGAAPSVEPAETAEPPVDEAEPAAAAVPEVAEATGSDLPAEPASATQPEPIDDLLAAIGEPAAVVTESKAYSPGGLDMNAYTCEDCVYVGTCPKANEDSPATCGSFQWKSV